MKSYVSMEQKVCHICGKTYDTGSILMDKRLKESLEDHTVTGWGICPDDQKLVNDGYVALVEVSQEEDDIPGNTLKQENADRTGRLIWIKREAFSKLIKGEIKDMAFMPEAVFSHIASRVNYRTK